MIIGSPAPMVICGWDLAEWSQRCASIPKNTGSNPSGGSDLTFRYDLLLTARGGNTCALIEFACLPCYLGNTLCSQRLEPPGSTWYALYKSRNLFLFYLKQVLEATPLTCKEPLQ
jgi:hypothetical protein